jgi:kumamolisin
MRQWTFITMVGALNILGGNALAAPPASQVSDQTQLVRLSGHVLPALASARPLNGESSAARASAATTASSAAADPDMLSLTVVLRRDDEEGFQRYLRDVYDERSPSFRKFLSPVQIADRFGPSPQTYAKTLNWMRQQNFALAQGSTDRMTLTVHGKRADAERALALRISDYAAGEQRFYANDRDPAVPADLASHIQAIAGLSNLAVPHPPGPQYAAVINVYCGISAVVHYFDYAFDASVLKKYGANAPDAAFKKAYAACVSSLGKSLGAGALPSADPPPPAWQGADGTGQTIGLVEFDTFYPSDVADYLSLIGLPANTIGNLSQSHVDGGAGSTPGANESEVLIDIDAIMAMAPGAKVIVYDGPFDGRGSFQAMFNAMIGGGPTIISNSWTYCEDQTNLADVQSIDSLLQTAAGAGISVFNASGDSGSSCLDGSAATIGVPADSPSATAVGGTSLTLGAGYTYVGETWWDGSNSTPPTGQGGFGVSRYFAKPSYQNATNAGTARAIPDVAASADPATGISICASDLGGCPTPQSFGGTSAAAPLWAGFTALLNQTQGSNLGALNSQLYPLANTDAFHSAASMGSDIAHVGLGSPNLPNLHRRLTGQTVGAVSASVSQVRAFAQNNSLAAAVGSPLFVFADGVSTGQIVVRLADANGNSVAGKTLSLSANSGSHASIAPNSVAVDANGRASFAITDLSVEDVTLTATDTTDGTALAETASIAFLTPPAAGGSIAAAPSPVVADGVSTTTITVTLADSLGRPTPGKNVLLAQSGSSLILGNSSKTTDANGQAQFNATDVVQETVTYTAVDASDGNLPIPGSASVTFNGGAGGCGGGTPVAAPGYAVSVFASGFTTQNGLYYGNVNIGGCLGASGLAFDPSGNLFVSNYITGDVFKFTAAGGIANAASKITATPIGPSLGALTFDHSGNLYGVRLSTDGSSTSSGAVLKIDTGTGTATAVSPGLTCPFNLATDPQSGDLFVDDGCQGGNPDTGNASIWRVANPNSSPVTSIYASTTSLPNGMLSFAPDGSLYVVTGYTSTPVIERIGATTQAQPASVQPISGVGSYYAVLASGSNPAGGAQTLIVGAPNIAGFGSAVAAYDMTTNPPSLASVLVESAIGASVIGPDQCIYGSSGYAVYKITNADGSCPLTFASAGLLLTPFNITPNPAQGTSQSFTASFHHATAAPGTPVTFTVAGANPMQKLVLTDANGNATFSYTAIHPGSDTIVARATLGNSPIVSNPANVTWTSGAHTTFLTLNSSVLGGTVGQPISIAASLTDLSMNPAAALSGQTVSFTLGSASCSGTTNASGIASCTITPSTSGLFTLAANFAGSAAYLPSRDTNRVNVLSVAATSLTTTSTSLSAAPNPVPAGQPLTLTATVSTSVTTVSKRNAAGIIGAAASPTGNVVFSDNGSAIGTLTLGASGQAILTTNSIGVGQHSLVATYSGDENDAGSSSAPLIVTVSAAVSAPSTAIPAPFLTSWACLILVWLVLAVTLAMRRASR